MWTRTCLVGKTPGELQEDMKDDEQKRADFVRSVVALEAIWNETPGYLKSVPDTSPVPSRVNIIEEEGRLDLLNLGVFWPEDVWVKELGSAFPKERGVFYTSGAIKYFGMWRDKKHGEPPGSITCSKTVATKVQRVRQVATAETSLQGNTDAAFR